MKHVPGRYGILDEQRAETEKNDLVEKQFRFEHIL